MLQIVEHGVESQHVRNHEPAAIPGGLEKAGGGTRKGASYIGRS